MIPTNFSALVGNETIKRYLAHMVEKGAIGNSLLFTGQEGIGKSLFAQVLAAMVIGLDDPQGTHRAKIEKGQHPDIHVYRPEGKLGLHSIQTMRQLSEEVYLPPYEAKWKVFIVHEADRMLTYSANALLKTFEEPPPCTLIILLSRSQSALLPTILSRCRILQFQTIPQATIEQFLIDRHQIDPQAAKNSAHLSQGSIGRAIQLIEHGGDTLRSSLLNLLAQGAFSCYKSLSEAVGELTAQIEKSRKQAEEAAKEELYKIPADQLSALQQHSLEKELEGLSTMAFIQETQTLFNQFLSWYRDLHVLYHGGARGYLINPDYVPELEQIGQRGNLPAIEQVQKMIDEAQLALQRSTSLQICLENLFLKLGYL
ncbi:ATP-binding protein [Candidatus Protochlamydia phocaeensis]|uniref:DNA polymerase III subunit n=1 Tax=Candidatus Protochlamydia phocaeensis TaxID=1414722 RepID=UPI0008389F75|nr:DNA polymerase III subunit delta' [Candidatus Protochlamydia phocaeensis]